MLIILSIIIIILLILTNYTSYKGGDINNHNILIRKIIKADVGDDDMIQSLVNANNYLVDNPHIKKEANWNFGDIHYSVLGGVDLPKFDNKIKYLNVGAGGGGSFYEDIKFLRDKFPDIEIISINRDVKDYIPKKLKLEIGQISTYKFQNASKILKGHYDITVFKVSLHHIPNASELISKLDSDVVIIREANVKTLDDLHMQTVEHMLYNMLEETNRKYMSRAEMEKYFNEYETNTGSCAGKTDNYYSREYWLKQFKNAGYKSIQSNADKKYMDKMNPSKIYREVFIKL